MASRSPTAFGTLLKRYRVAALLTQEELATRAQLSADTIRALERGKRRTPRPESARLLADALALTGAEREALLAAAAPPEIGLYAGDRTPPPLPGRMASGASQPSPLVGRESELETIRERLVDDRGGEIERARLLTLTGPAGVGKTRLALAAATQIADQFPGGVALVDLSPVRDPMLVLPTIAHALGVADTGSRPLLERLCDFLRERSMLLVLDNFEQVLPAAGTLANLLANCPGLVLLVTSRVPLRLRWEWTLRVPPLPVPDLTSPLPPLDTLKEIPAIALFTARARARRADFALTATQAPLVARLAAELDGLPLALELAAARLDALSLPTLARRLSDRLRFLRWEATDLPERQRSLEAAVGWSYDLLSEPERRLFRCLGVFAGHVALPAIATVSAATSITVASATSIHGAEDVVSEENAERTLEGLASLAEKSLVLSAQPYGCDGHDGYGAEGYDANEANEANEAKDEEDSEPAFTMLETVREYAWEQLARLGTLEAARRAHAHYFLDLAERADPYLRARDQLAWYFRLEREHNNLRAALRWLLSYEGADAAAEREAGLRLAAALGWFWWTRGYIVEGARWLVEALDRAPEADPEVRALALLRAGVMLAYQGAFDRAEAVLEEALAVAQRCENSAEVAQALSYLGLRAVYAGNVAAGVPLLREALRREQELGDAHQMGMTLMFLGAATIALGDDEQAIAHYTASRAHFEAAGDWLFAANLQLNLGWFAWRRGELRTAVRYTRTGIEAGVTSGNRRLLSFGAQMALSLAGYDGGVMDVNAPGKIASRTDLAQRARLLGVVDALSQATGMTLLQTLLKSSLAELREQIQRAESEGAYREGRSLPFKEIATLALTLLERVPQTLPQSEHRPEPTREVAGELHSPLSPRQNEVLRLVAQGLSNKAIGRQLFLSPSTINYHLTSLFNKLGVDTRAQAVAVAARRGLL